MKGLATFTPISTIVVDEPALQKGFTIVPNYLFGLKKLSHGARLTYILLLKYAWQEGSCFPGLTTLAQLLEVERKSVIRYKQELMARGLVSVERRGQGKTNIYHLNRWGQPVLEMSACPLLQSLPQTRSPISGTSKSTTQRTSKSPPSGTGIIPSLPRLNNGVIAVKKIPPKEPARIQYLVDEILQVCKDIPSTAYYRLVASRIDDDLIFRWLSEIRQDLTITNRGAVFTSKVKDWQRRHPHPNSK